MNLLLDTQALLMFLLEDIRQRPFRPPDYRPVSVGKAASGE